MTRIKTLIAAGWRWSLTAMHSVRYLWVCRAAIPWPIRIILALAVLIKCVPVDFGIDEALTLVAAALLAKLRPGLMSACWQAARLR